MLWAESYYLNSLREVEVVAQVVHLAHLLVVVYDVAACVAADENRYLVVMLANASL
jgi:hypothetical protein